MTYDQFKTILQNQSSYESIRNKRFSLGKIIGFTSLAFYIRILLVNYLACRKTRKIKNYFEEWGNDSYSHIKTVEAVGGKLYIEGLKNLAKLNTPAVFIGNHMSSLESMILPAMILPFMEVTYVIKSSLLNYPTLGEILKKVEAITVSRTNPKDDLRKVFDQAGSMLKNGRSIIIFPQQTRSVSFDSKSFNSIGIKLAKREGVPIIPVAIKSDFWSNGKIFKDFGMIDISIPVRVSFGEAFYVNSNGKKEHEMVLDYIQSQLKKWTN